MISERASEVLKVNFITFQQPGWLFPPIFVLSYSKLAVILSYLLYRHESGINLLI